MLNVLCLTALVIQITNCSLSQTLEDIEEKCGVATCSTYAIYLHMFNIFVFYNQDCCDPENQKFPICFLCFMIF